MKKHLLGTMLVLSATAAMAQSGAQQSTHRLVVTLKPQAHVQGVGTAVKLAATLDARGPRELKLMHRLSSGASVYDLGESMSLEKAQDIARRLQADPNVLSAEPDVRVRRLFTPTDPYFYAQWGLFNATSSEAGAKGGMNAQALWLRTLGSKTTMAVLDTGLVQHPELVGRILPGYDFITDVTTAGDGNGRDADPTDVGDFCTDGSGNVTDTSSWHGTKVAGIMAASSDSQGVAGVAPQAKILNVRVLGRCGGWLSDVADAVRWTAGGSVSGVPKHAYGPMVMNLSLATDTSIACPAYMQAAITDAAAAGSIVVVASGNEGKNAVGAPGNCANVITVAAHTGNADLTTYANYLPSVTVSGPAGGNCLKDTANCYTYPAATIGVTGRTVFEAYSGPVYMAGTSAAAPYVAAALGLLKELEPTLTTAQAISWLRNGSRAFPSTSFCHGNAQCGFGMLDAELLLAQLDAYYTPTVTLAPSASSGRKGDTITVTASASSKASGTSFTYAWSQKSGPSVTLQGSGASVSFAVPDGKGTVVLEVAATDSGNRTVKATTSVNVTNGQAPKVQAVASQSAVEGQSWSLSPAVTDADNDFDRLVVTKAPEGLAVQEGKLVWAAAVRGTHEIRFVAKDKEGLESTEQVFTLTVAAKAAEDNGSGGGGSSSMGLLGLVLMGAAFGVKRLARSRAQA